MRYEIAYQAGISPNENFSDSRFLTVLKKDSQEFPMGNLMMPVKDCIRLIRSIKVQSGTKHHPIIILNVKADKAVQTSPGDQMVQKILEILDKHISDSDFSINQLSAELHMSRAQVFRKVQEITGSTPNNLLRNIRLKKAADLFDNGHKNVSQVMYQVGFNNQSYFAKCFKELYHLNPSQYISRKSA